MSVRSPIQDLTDLFMFMIGDIRNYFIRKPKNFWSNLKSENGPILDAQARYAGKKNSSGQDTAMINQAGAMSTKAINNV